MALDLKAAQSAWDTGQKSAMSPPAAANDAQQTPKPTPTLSYGHDKDPMTTIDPGRHMKGATPSGL